MKQIKLILTALLMIFWAGETSAQMARLYTSGSGLPNSQIYDIYQDSRGFIWISTENGLARFDGMDFNTFNFDRNNPNSIASDFVLAVIEDSFGTYWVGTSAGLQTFDPENEVLRFATSYNYEGFYCDNCPIAHFDCGKRKEFSK